MRKALKTVGLMLIIAVIALIAVNYAFGVGKRPADANPNDILARKLMPYLRDGSVFTLADVYPDAWDTVQVMSGNQRLSDWEWRTLSAFDAGLTQIQDNEQLLIFWCDGEIARAVRFAQDTGGMPRFLLETDLESGAILSRENAVFLATLMNGDDTAYYVCVPQAAQTAL